MMNGGVTKYSKDTSKDNSLFLFHNWLNCAVLSATLNKNLSVL